MRIPERLDPAGIRALLSAGVVDIGALLCYLAVILAVGLCAWWLRRRSLASRVALASFMAVLGLAAALSPWQDRVPPLYADLSRQGVLSFDAEFQERLVAACGPDALTLSLSAPDGERDPLIHAFLSRLSAPGADIKYTSRYEPGGAVNSLFVQLGGGVTEIPYERLIAVNPADAGGRKRWFKLQAELIQAIELLRARPPKIYRAAGPEDISRPTVLMDAVRGITAEPLTPHDLSRPVPEDCTFIIMDNPQRDLTALQAGLIRSYLGRGGRLLLITDYVYGAMPNLNSALEEYGLSAIDGAVFDPGSAMGGRAEYPVPELNPGGHVIARWLACGQRMPLMPLSHGITVHDIDGVDGVALLTTTDEAYCQLNGIAHESLDRGDGDPQGPFCLAAAAQNGSGKLVWIASTDMATAEADADVGGANAELLLASMRWLMDAQSEPVAAHAME